MLVVYNLFSPYLIRRIFPSRNYDKSCIEQVWYIPCFTVDLTWNVSVMQHTFTSWYNYLMYTPSIYLFTLLISISILASFIVRIFCNVPYSKLEFSTESLFRCLSHTNVIFACGFWFVIFLSVKFINRNFYAITRFESFNFFI